MRRNRKIPQKLSVVASHYMHMGTVLLTLFAVVILNMLAVSRCTQLKNSLETKKLQLQKLDAECQRESARWAEMKTTESLETALVKHGLSMHYPNPSQIVRMRADGTPVPGQLALAKISRRAAASATAMASLSPAVAAPRPAVAAVSRPASVPSLPAATRPAVSARPAASARTSGRPAATSRPTSASRGASVGSRTTAARRSR